MIAGEFFLFFKKQKEITENKKRKDAKNIAHDVSLCIVTMRSTRRDTGAPRTDIST